MEMARIFDFSLYRVAGIAFPKLSPRACVSGIGIACLNHKSIDHPVEQHPIVKPLANKLKEIVAVKRSVVVEFHHHIAHGGL